MPYKKLLSDEFIVKNIILFTMSNYSKPVSNPVLSDMIMSDVDIDYFLIQKCLFDLVGLKWIRTFKEDGDYKYELDGEGKETCRFFEKKIPYIIRQKILFAIKRQKVLEMPKTEVKTGIEVSENGQFNTYISVYEKGDKLFELNINVGSRDFAKKTAKYFEENAYEIYTDITKSVFKDIK